MKPQTEAVSVVEGMHRSAQRSFAMAPALSMSFALVLLCSPPIAGAQDPLDCIEDLSDDEVRSRIETIESHLRRGKRSAAVRRYTWMGIFAGLSAGAARLAIRARNDERNSDEFGYDYLATGFLVSAILRAAIPAPDVWGAKRIAQQDGSTPEARVAKLRFATETLEGASAVQGAFASPLGLFGTTIIAAVGGTIKAVRWPGSTRGLTAGMFLVSPTLASLAIATAPREAIRAWTSYRESACPHTLPDDSREDPEVNFGVNPFGATLTVEF